MTVYGRDPFEHDKVTEPYRVPNPEYVEGGNNDVPGSAWPHMYPNFVIVEEDLDGSLILCKGCGAIIHEDCSDAHADFHTRLEEDHKSAEDARTLTSIIKAVWSVSLHDVPLLAGSVSKALDGVFKESPASCPACSASYEADTQEPCTCRYRCSNPGCRRS